MAIDPRTRYPQPPFPDQEQAAPGSSARMKPEPSYGADSYKGSGRLTDRVAIITAAIPASAGPSRWPLREKGPTS